VGLAVAKTDESRLTVMPIIVGPLLCICFTAMCNASHSALAATFGGLLVTTLVLPPLVLASDNWLIDIAVVWASTLGVACVWLVLPISWPQWWECGAVLISLSVAVSTTTVLLHRVGIHGAVAAAVVVVATVAWLSWPVWMSPWLGGHETLVNVLVAGHPLLAINGTLIDQGIWTERPEMYGWTALNQDVTFAMPTSVLGCVVLHGGIGAASAALLGAMAAIKRQRPPRSTQRHREHGEKSEGSRQPE
jgi:hypothetical protein